jgi:hypothetical protein
MGRSQEPDRQPGPVRADLVEYLIVTVGDVGGLPTVADALATLAAAGTVRILDLVVLACDHDGEVTVLELEAVPEMASLRDHPSAPGLFSERDIQRASLAVPGGAVGVVVVTEDRWAAPLSEAARSAGGRIVAGDRIPQRRVEAALAVLDPEGPGGS